MIYGVICIVLLFLILLFGVLLNHGGKKEFWKVWGKLIWIGGVVVVIGVCLWLFQRIF